VNGGSYPSGHASNAFASAGILAALPNGDPLASEMAAQVAFGRVYAAAHFPSDIAAGAFIGTAAATFTLARPDHVLPPRPKP